MFYKLGKWVWLMSAVGWFITAFTLPHGEYRDVDLIGAAVALILSELGSLKEKFDA